MKKNEIYEVTITDYTEDGLGIGKAGTFPLFVKNVCVGDTVRCRILKDKKTYAYAKVEEVTSPSPDRVIPECPLAGPCGGCQLQMMSYEAEKKFKQKKVTDSFRRIGKFSDFTAEETVGMDCPWRYRNKAQVPVGKDKNGRIVFGFYAGHTHDIIPADDCLLTPEYFAGYLKDIRLHMEKYHIEPYDEETGTGLLRHVLIREGRKTKEVLICLVVNGDTFPHAEFLIRKYPEVSWSLNVNRDRNNVILGRETRALSKKATIEDYIGDFKFRISPQSFFQINPEMTEKLYQKAVEFADLHGTETVWDVYCGIGTIGLFASRTAAKVYGVEVIGEAVKNARENARENGIENAEFFTGKAEDVLPRWYAENPDEKIDVVILDPPRKGCDEKCIKTVLAMRPKRIVYVSCDPATLARDARRFADNGYQLQAAVPHDMFSQTVSVETVALMTSF